MRLYSFVAPSHLGVAGARVRNPSECGYTHVRWGILIILDQPILGNIKYPELDLVGNSRYPRHHLPDEKICGLDRNDEYIIV